jgi:hypothetical protein
MSYVLPSRSAISIISPTFLIMIAGSSFLISLLGYSKLTEGQPQDNIINDMGNISTKGTMDTFDMTGPISGLIYTDMQYSPRVMAPEILSGKWDLKVIKGKVDYFVADFEQVGLSGIPFHNIELTNFTEEEKNKDSQIVVNDTSNTAIRGTLDIIFDHKPMKNIPVEIFLNKLKVIEMHFYIDKSDPFRGKPITGVISSLIDM